MIERPIMAHTCSQGGFVKILEALRARLVLGAYHRSSRPMRGLDAGHMRVRARVEHGE